MSLNPNYVIAPSLEMYFVDKTSGAPLSGGFVYFWSDINRTTPKAVYQLSGSPPNYSYVELPNPVTLSGVGTFQDNDGNNVVPYYFPFDDNGNVEEYYIEVFSSDMTPQFVREGWPNFTSDTVPLGSLEIINYIPNPQFLIHYLIPGNDLVSPAVPVGKITQPVTILAPGGWTFERPSGSTAIDNVSFFRFDAAIISPPPDANPRYAVQVTNTGVDLTDPYKDLRITFDDVNKFSGSQPYTFSFVAESLGGSFDVIFSIVKNFGSGGSSQVTISKTTFTITNTEQLFQYSFSFGTNEAYTIGENDDDNVQLAITFPINQTFSGILTDFILTIGDITIDSFPPTTNADMLSRSLVPPTPDPAGFNIGLPIILTKSGYGYDDTQVGKIYSCIYGTPGFGELLCDGNYYETSGYSSDGIPYARLQSKLVIPNSANITLFGNGVNFVNAYTLGTAALTFSTNKPGSQTATSDGAAPTGFTFNTFVTGTATNGFNAYFGPINLIYIESQLEGIPFGANVAGTSGFTFTNYRPGSALTKNVNQVYIEIPPSTGTGNPASYFRISNTTTQYYFWFNYVGEVDPSPGGTGIEITLTPGITNTGIVAKAVVAALLGYQTTYVTTIAGSSLPNSSYFTFYANSQLYYVWYSLNNTGTDPNLFNGIGLKVIYQTSDTNINIEASTGDVINGKYFSTPDLRSMFIRGWANSSTLDPEVDTRFSSNYFDSGNSIGSLQLDTFAQHIHPSISFPGITAIGGGGATAALNGPSGPTGLHETRPVNMQLNYVIKY